ncbi:MAG: hypothetical protein JXX14_10650 [Deltaproteobacteria bacterium]|nr:hypothetical protein [Deltaproteobacteria bacterium]
MSEMINKYVEIKVDEKSKVLTVKFLDRIPLDDFKKAVQFEYDMIGRHKLQKAFIDLRLMPVYPAGATELIKEEWFPKVISLGLKSIAFVQPQSVIAKLSMTSAHKEDTKSPVTMNHFGNAEEALAWLKSL